MTATVQIVSAVGSGGSVLFDLNRHLSGALLGRGAEFAKVAQQQQAGDQPFRWTPTPLGATPVELATRQITVPVVLFAATPDAVGVLQRQLQQLVASRFVLKLQRHGSATPVWLRCAAGALDVPTRIGAAEQPTMLLGTLTAATEPYALGARVDVGPVTITQDPASGTPFVWDINSVGGDSLTPLVIRCADTDVLGQVDRIFISTRRRGVPSSLAGLVVQAEAAATATGTAPPAISTFTSDSTFSGGSGLRGTYGVGASGPWSATATFASLVGGEAPGLYRLMVRVRRAGGAAGALFSLVATVGQQRQVETFTASGNDTRIIDMGLVQVPIGQPPFMAAPETPTSAAAPVVSVAFVRAAEGTGTLDVDWVGLFPADTDAGVLECSQASTGVLALDGWDQQPRLFTTDPYTGTTPAASGAPGWSFIGGAPRLQPGSNRLFVVAGLGAAVASARAPSLALDLSASYWPRYGWLG